MVNFEILKKPILSMLSQNSAYFINKIYHLLVFTHSGTMIFCHTTVQIRLFFGLKEKKMNEFFQYQKR